MNLSDCMGLSTVGGTVSPTASYDKKMSTFQRVFHPASVQAGLLFEVAFGGAK